MEICTSGFLDKHMSQLIHLGGVTSMHGEGGTMDERRRWKLEIGIHHRIVGTPDNQTYYFHSYIPPLIFFHPLSKVCVEVGMFSSRRPRILQCWPELGQDARSDEWPTSSSSLQGCAGCSHQVGRTHSPHCPVAALGFMLASRSSNPC